MVDHEVLDSQLKTDRFPFPSEGDITLRVRNTNYTLGPAMLHIGMRPGAVIPAHLHKGMAEALCLGWNGTSVSYPRRIVPHLVHCGSAASSSTHGLERRCACRGQGGASRHF